MYRLEIDALNAIVTEQRKTNELLSQMITLLTTKTTEIPMEHKPVQRRGRKKQYDYK